MLKIEGKKNQTTLIGFYQKEKGTEKNLKDTGSLE